MISGVAAREKRPFLKLWLSVWIPFSLASLAAMVPIVAIFVVVDLFGREDEKAALFSDFLASETAFISATPSGSASASGTREILELGLSSRFAWLMKEAQTEAAIGEPWAASAFAATGEKPRVMPISPEMRPPAGVEAAIGEAMRAVEGDGKEKKVIAAFGIIVAAPVEGAGGSPSGAIAVATAKERLVGPFFFRNMGENALNLLFSIVLPCGFCAGLAFALILRRRILPLRVSAEAFLEGDFAPRYRGSRKDEIGLLAGAIERLGAGLPALLEERQERGAWEERGRIARELHDGIKQELFALKLNAGTLRKKLEASAIGADALESARGLEEGLGAALAKTQGMLSAFSPALLPPESLGPSIERELERWKAAGLLAETRLLMDMTPPDAKVAQASYWIAKEALCNVAKHAPGSTVEVGFGAEGGRYVLWIRDDGPGAGREPGGGLGIALMKSRAREAGGALSVGSTPGGGTEVRAVFGADRS